MPSAVPTFPVESIKVAVMVCAPVLKLVVSIVPEKIVPVQAAPAPFATPSTRMVTILEAVSQVPSTEKWLELLRSVTLLASTGVAMARIGAVVSFTVTLTVLIPLLQADKIAINAKL